MRDKETKMKEMKRVIIDEGGDQNEGDGEKGVIDGLDEGEKDDENDDGEEEKQDKRSK